MGHTNNIVDYHRTRLLSTTTAFAVLIWSPSPTLTHGLTHEIPYGIGCTATIRTSSLSMNLCGNTGNNKALYYQNIASHEDEATSANLSLFIPRSPPFARSTNTNVATTPEFSRSSSVPTKEVDNSINNRYSSSDWLHNISTLPQSTILTEIRNPVSIIAIWSQFVAFVYHVLCGFSSTQSLAQKMCISSLPHSLLVSSLGLLLVFRTNSAYQRFAEGRKIWEQIHSVSRNFSRMINLYEKKIGKARKHRIQKLLAAFPYLLRHHIRPCCYLREDIVREGVADAKHLLRLEERPQTLETRFEDDKRCAQESRNQFDHCWVDRRAAPWSLLPMGTLEPVARAVNRPLWVCDRLAKEVLNIRYDGNEFTSRERLAMLSTVEKLSNAVGQCEKIHHTAVPLNYARHSLRSLTLWLFSLPFVLVKDCGLLTGAVMGAISWLLFGVYQIGYSIEDPFQGTLRLSELCEAIRKDVLGDASVRRTAFDTTVEEDSTITPSACLGTDLVRLSHNYALTEDMKSKLKASRVVSTERSLTNINVNGVSKAY